MNQTFHITAEVISALSEIEVRATCKGLREMGLFHLPYPTVDLIVPTDSVMTVDGKRPDKKFGPDHWIRITLDETCTESLITFEMNGRPIYDSKIYLDRMAGKHPTAWKSMIVAADPWRDMLIAVLASRNIVKETVGGKLSKLARLGIGKARTASAAITYIRLQPVLPADDDGKPSNTKRRPHLRRGHIRNQRDRFGHHKVWIAPIFVNADKGFVETRAAYAFIR